MVRLHRGKRDEDRPDVRDRRRRRRPAAFLDRSGVVRVLTLGLWMLVVAGFVLGAAALAASSRASLSDPVRPAADSSGAEGFAELYVSAFLQAGEGTEEDLRPFLPDDLDLASVAPRSLYVVRAASLGANAVGSHYWAVTVGAEVLTATEGGYALAGHRYFTVGILKVPGGYVATSVPAEVPGPDLQDPLELNVDQLDYPSDDAATRAVARFLDAYLARQGELARYAAPGSGLRPISSPYSAAELIAAGFSETSRGALTRARVRAVDSNGRVALLEFSLELVERAGRWEVVRLLGAPPLERD